MLCTPSRAVPTQDRQYTCKSLSIVFVALNCSLAHYYCIRGHGHLYPNLQIQSPVLRCEDGRWMTCPLTVTR